jgi:hypothetical protein
MREQEIINRLKYFLKDLSASAKPLENIEDKIAFIKALSELQMGMYKSDEEYFDEDAFIDEYLLAKFRSKMKTFVSAKMHYYFSQDEIFQESLNQRLQINPPVILNGEEFLEFTLRLYGVLDLIKTNLYLTELNKPDITSEQNQIQELLEQKSDENLRDTLKLKNHEFTRSRQVLAMFYLFKSIGINPRFDISVTALAKFAHLLSGMPYENADNSSIYKLMKKLPDLKSENYLVEDLEFVKKHFEMVKHKEAVILLEKEIEILNKKLNKN